MTYEYVLKKGETFHGVSHSILADGSEIWTNGKDREYYETDDYEIISEAEYQKLLDDFVSDITGKWQEISKESYNDQLNVLPTVKCMRGGFFVSEAYTLYVHSFYQEYFDRYYEAYFEIYKPREDILKSLAAFVEAQEKESI